jgi:amino acid transporter
LTTAIILVASVFLDFKTLLTIVNYLTLGIFIMVDLALMQLQRKPEQKNLFRVPRWIPPLAVILSATMILAEIIENWLAIV